MKKLAVVSCVLVLLVAAGGVFAGEEGSWTGEVLDMKCYAQGQKGAGHAGCAVRCLNGGSEMGLLVDGDVVHIDAAASDADALKTLKNLGGKQAKVSGEAKKDGDKVTVTVKAAAAA
ncbi:MAG TPA: hypothetical protein VNB06_06215 [Thermoanaerobaculia bacterium]|nr:hypothetical protein [Thermoanaerobaculia bacterium]